MRILKVASCKKTRKENSSMKSFLKKTMLNSLKLNWETHTVWKLIKEKEFIKSYFLNSYFLNFKKISWVFCYLSLSLNNCHLKTPTRNLMISTIPQSWLKIYLKENYHQKRSSKLWQNLSQTLQASICQRKKQQTLWNYSKVINLAFFLEYVLLKMWSLKKRV